MMHRLRNYFLTGLIIAAPLFITVFITWNFIQWVDGIVKPLLPGPWQPDQYLPFVVPGFGVVAAVIVITFIGFMTANFLGRRLVHLGESILGQMPLVRNLYRGLKQIFETILSDRAKAFQQVALVEYPLDGLYAICFVSAKAQGEIAHHLDEEGGAKEDPSLGVFIPTTPNPTSGFLIFVKRSKLTFLDMNIEDAAKLVISAGLVTPEFDGKKVTQPTAADARPGRGTGKSAEADPTRFNPPSAA